MKKIIQIHNFFDEFPIEPEKQLALLENLYQKYPTSHYVTFFYLKFLQDRYPKKFETLKAKLLLFIPDRKVFHDSILEYYYPDYFTTDEPIEENSDEIAVLAEQFMQNAPKIKFDPTKHNADVNLAELCEVEDIEFISETLAMIYAEQGYSGKASQMLKKLMLQNPEKNTYFAALIEKVKNSIKQNQNLEENNH